MRVDFLAMEVQLSGILMLDEGIKVLVKELNKIISFGCGLKDELEIERYKNKLLKAKLEELDVAQPFNVTQKNVDRPEDLLVTFTNLVGVKTEKQHNEYSEAGKPEYRIHSQTNNVENGFYTSLTDSLDIKDEDKDDDILGCLSAYATSVFNENEVCDKTREDILLATSDTTTVADNQENEEALNMLLDVCTKDAEEINEVCDKTREDILLATSDTTTVADNQENEEALNMLLDVCTKDAEEINENSSGLSGNPFLAPVGFNIVTDREGREVCEFHEGLHNTSHETSNVEETEQVFEEKQENKSEEPQLAKPDHSVYKDNTVRIMDDAQVAQVNETQPESSQSTPGIMSLPVKACHTRNSKKKGKNGKKKKFKRTYYNTRAYGKTKTVKFLADNCMERGDVPKEGPFFVERKKYLARFSKPKDRSGKSYTTTNNFTCETCFKTFSHFVHLKWHQKVHETQVAISCCYCFKEFKNSSSLNMHMKIHTEGKSFVCRFCYKLFMSKAVWKMHVQKHGAESYQCESCFRRFSNKNALMKHFQVHTKDKESCNKDSVGKQGLARQELATQGSVASESVELEMDTRKFPTHGLVQREQEYSISGNEGNSHGNFRMSAESGGKQKVYMCETCNKSFSTKYNLFLHTEKQRISYSYKCESCSKSFSTKHGLVIHIGKHNKGYPYKCETCCKEFVAQAELMLHLHKHKNEVSDHRKSCTTATYGLVQHGPRHKQKVYGQFNSCNNELTSKKNLDNTKDSFLVCQFCSKRCNSKYGLLKHIGSHKKEPSSR